jgi:hypothetical protein
MQSEHLVQAFQHWRRWLIACLGFVTALLLYCWWEAALPNETLSFSREVTSKADVASLSPRLDHVTEWKNWFFTAQDIEVVDSQNHPLPKAEQVVREGALLNIQVDPGKGSRRRFQIAAKVTHYIPGKLVEIQVLDDSSGKIFHLFDQLSWKIEVSPQASGSGTQIIGTETAHTTHWRSRLFGRIASRVMLNQLFYPNLMVLADPKTPPKAEVLF